MSMRLALIVMLTAGCVSNWRPRDTVFETGAIAVTAVDWYQTIGITKNCNEMNPIIGECGERVNMHVYFVTMLIAEIVSARLLSPTWRNTFHGAWIGSESATTMYNALR